MIEFILDFLIVADIIVSFFSIQGEAEPGVTVTNKYIAIKYVSFYFWFDCLSSIPGLVTSERNRGGSLVYYLKMFRYS
jgi:hypothetical protein